MKKEIQNQLQNPILELKNMTAAEMAIQEASKMTRSPFVDAIIREPKPFQPPKMKTYDGKSDPVVFLHQYRQVMSLETDNDAMYCKVFPRMLAGTAATCFNQLKPGSIATFEELSLPFAFAFVRQFIFNVKEKKKMSSLSHIKERPRESLKMYLERYTNEFNQIENDEMAASMFKDGLARDHELYEKLTRKPARSMAEVILKVEGCVRVEEAGPTIKREVQTKKKCRGTI